MKKTILSLAFVAALLTSCKENTQEKATEAADAVTTEAVDAAAEGAEAVKAAADSATVKAAGAVETGAAKLEDAAKDVKEDAKK